MYYKGMTQATNTEPIEKGTGKPWSEWLTYLESVGAANLSHKEIAQKVYEHGSPGWWAQYITVAYEQHIGRRIPGQDHTGSFAVSVNKTMDGSMDEVMGRWVDFTGDRPEFSGIPVTRQGALSQSEKWRYWRCGLADGSRVLVSVSQKAPGKALFTVTSEKLESMEQLEHWRAYWKEFLRDF